MENLDAKQDLADQLTFWIGRRDNKGFIAGLQKALDKCVIKHFGMVDIGGAKLKIATARYKATRAPKE